MKLLCTATYYHPHISGLTAVAQTIAEEMAVRGHTVTVLTSRYDSRLPEKETIHGVQVVRVPVLCRISKGPVMPSYLRYAFPLIKEHDLILTHLPASPPEILAYSFPTRLFSFRPTIAMYHCDLELPPSPWNICINAVVLLSNSWMMSGADCVVSHSEDYTLNSRTLLPFLRKISNIPPPVSIPLPRPSHVEMLRSRYAPDGESIIGFVGRWAAEKGLDGLLAALPYIRRKIPKAKVLCAGESYAIGEQLFLNCLQSKLVQNHESWEILGRLKRQELADFYGACDLTVLPSINATESLGLVQVESMLCGTPVVASSLPGVRRPVQITGMGRLVPCCDNRALADAIVDVIQNRERYLQPREAVENHFSSKTSMDRYETLFKQIAEKPHRFSLAGSPLKASIDNRVPVGPEALETRSSADVLHSYLTTVTPFHALVRSVENRLLKQSGQIARPLLDLGCSNGFFASLLFPEPPEAGIDPDFRQCLEALARKTHKTIIAASGTAMPFSDGHFRTVMANCVLEHIPDIDAALQEIFRVLCPGGSLLFGVPSHCFGEMLFFSTYLHKFGLKQAGRAYGNWFNRHSRHFHTDTPEVWIKRLERHGFCVDHWEYYLTAAGLQVFDLAHYLSLPNLLCRKLTGRWVVFPLSLTRSLWERWLRPHAEALPEKQGPYIFFIARRLETG
ncbi:MAG: glycosyltransferase [Pseudomonadota bacterium]